MFQIYSGNKKSDVIYKSKYNRNPHENNISRVHFRKKRNYY